MIFLDDIFLMGTQLFNGVSEDELKRILSCIGAYKKEFQKGEIIFSAGSAISEVGMVLSGSVNIVVNFYWGESQIFAHVERGEVFGENYAAIKGKELICDVLASEKCEILFLNMQSLLTTCESACSFHHRIIQNMLCISAEKNLALSERMMHIAPKSIRSRLLSYLSEQAAEHGSMHFTIPFNRQQLADYLGVDRSAMSNELSKMRRDGLIKCRKSEFILNRRDNIYEQY